MGGSNAGKRNSLDKRLQKRYSRTVELIFFCNTRLRLILLAGDEAGDSFIKSSLSASVWKVACSPGYVVQSAEDVLIVLEAMKTEVNVEAGEENVGRRVRSLGKDIRPGGLVQAGDTLLVLE